MVKKLGLFVFGLLLGLAVVVTLVRARSELASTVQAPEREAPDPDPESVNTEPDVTAAPPAVAETVVETSAEYASEDIDFRERTKSGETFSLRSVDGWEAELRDRGHRRGFVIRIRRSGVEEPVESVIAEDVMRAGARALAIGLLRTWSAAGRLRRPS